MNKHKVIFADESSTNIWGGQAYMKKTWQFEDDPIQHRMHKGSKKNVTMIGACSNFLPGLVL